MNKILVHWLGDLETEMVHLKNNKRVVCDAPIDNFGRGMSFSPTDLVAGATLSCIFTIVAIEIKKKRLPSFLGLEGKVIKIMANAPRRISRLELYITVRGGTKLSPKQRKIIEDIIQSSPVRNSLNPEIQIYTEIEYT